MGVSDLYELKRDVAELKEGHGTLTADTQKLTETVDKLYNDVMNLQKAFPGDDAMSHRRYHELLIEEIDAKKKLRQAIMEKTISGLIWSAIVGLSILMWRGLLTILAKGGLL